MQVLNLRSSIIKVYVRLKTLEKINYFKQLIYHKDSFKWYKPDSKHFIYMYYKTE